jgi:tetratricopeptide (TPR) repeat protein
VKRIKIVIVLAITLAFFAPVLLAQGNRALWSQENYIQSAKIHYKHVYLKSKLREELDHCIDLIGEAVDRFEKRPELHYMLGTFYAEVNVYDTMDIYFDSTQIYCDDETVDEKWRKKCYKKDKLIQKMDQIRQDAWEKSFNDGVDYLAQYDTVLAWQDAAPTEDSARALDSVRQLAFTLSKENFETAVMVMPDSIRTYDALAVLLQREEQHQEAIEIYTKALDLIGETPPLISKIAYAYIYIPDWENAIIWFEKYLEHDSEDINALINLSVAYSNMGNHDKWFEYTTRVLELQPDNTQFLFNAGQYWFMQMQDAAGQMAEITDSTPDADAQRAELEKQSNEARDKSIASFKEITRIDPQDKDALKRLGILYLLSAQNEEAIEVLERSVEIDPSDIDVLDFLGRAYIQKGDTKAAIKPYEMLVESDPGNIDAWERLGELYEYNSMPDKSKEALDKAEELKNL